MRNRFTESQIVTALKKQELGITAKEICRELGISEATFYNWKAKYGGIEVSDVTRMQQMELELSKYKKMVASQQKPSKISSAAGCG